MTHSLNSLKGVIQGTIIGYAKGDTGSLDYGSCVVIQAPTLKNGSSRGQCSLGLPLHEHRVGT